MTKDELDLLICFAYTSADPECPIWFSLYLNWQEQAEVNKAFEDYYPDYFLSSINSPTLILFMLSNI